MRKQCKRVKRPAHLPTLVALQVNPEVGLTERLAAQAFASGFAGERQFDVLADCRDLLMLSAAERKQQDALDVCDITAEALEAIKARHAKTGKFGATGEEQKALRLLVNFSEDYWKRTSGTHFVDANRALDKARGL